MKQRSLWRRIVDFPLVSMVIGVLVILIGLTVAGAIAKFAIPGKAAGPVNYLTGFYLVAMPILVLLYVFVIAKLGRHPRNDLRDPKAVQRGVAGLAAGGLLFSVVVAVAAALGVYRIVGPGDTSGMVAALLGSALFPALSEEMLFRGVLFRWLEEFGGSWLALFLTSAFFGASHLLNPNASSIAAIGIAVEAGVMLGAAYMLTRSLWLPMGIHAAWNFTQGEIYDIPVSGMPVHGVVDARLCCNPLLTGNGFGLEASLIAMVIATLFGLWLLWLAIRRGELKRPMWMQG
ncbi:CPBP family intramembrane glutamic endopeptidase [Sphingomonas sp. URHD0057]|uniref:CPBP family intramembrane glutamic endopeptidase n=1 Tax=Sphingomonas sp. URHD0057 TaxID=1380389 RepID=UPI00048C00CA|nr:type II CAAX endopeptidase family protein [Sphingomonas sp. URHD0057]